MPELVGIGIFLLFSPLIYLSFKNYQEKKKEPEEKKRFEAEVLPTLPTDEQILYQLGEMRREGKSAAATIAAIGLLGGFDKPD